MFETEAEEYIKKHTFFDEEFGLTSVDVTSKTAFQEGAEFGYDKANEWHYVKDGDLPKDKDKKLCFYGKWTVVAGYNREYGCWEAYFNNRITVIPLSVIIAWKEIILPEIKESE